MKRGRLGDRSRLPHREHAHTKLIVWGSVFLLCALVGLGVWGMHSSKVRIVDITVRGTEALDPEKIKTIAEETLEGKYLWIIPKNNTLVYPKDTMITNVIEAFSRIKDIEVARDGFRGISIGVAEYTPESVWCGDWYMGERDPTEQCYFVDEFGYIFGLAPDISGTAYFKYYGELPEPGHPVGQYMQFSNSFKELKTFLDLLDTITLEPVVVYWNVDEDYVVYLKKGGELRIAMEDDLTEVFDNLQLILKSDEFKKDYENPLKQLEYIDMRFGDRVLFRFMDIEVSEEE